MVAVTVLMAAYNSEDYIVSSIESVLEQTLADFEFLIINDGSTDHTREIILHYKKLDSRIEFIENERNIGLAKTLNRGLECARGKFIARQDADDISLPRRLEREYALLKLEQQAAVVGCWCELIDSVGTVFGRFDPPDKRDELVYSLAKLVSPIAHGSAMFDRCAVNAVGGYDDRFWFAQDYDLWLRLLAKDGKGIRIVTEPLYQLRKTPPRSRFKEMCQRRYAELAWSQYRQNTHIDFEDVGEWVLRRNKKAKNYDPGHVGDYWISLGYAALQIGRMNLARQYIWRALQSAGVGIVWTVLWGMTLSLLPLGALRKIKRSLVKGD